MTNPIIAFLVVLSACGSVTNVELPDASGPGIDSVGSTDPVDARAADASGIDPLLDAPSLDAPPLDAPPAPSCASTIPAGFTRRAMPTVFTQVPAVTPQGSYLNNFPVTGGGVGYVVGRANQFVSIAFTPPTNPAAYQGLARRFEWSESQIGGEASLNGIYVSVTTCPGDLRVPASTQAPANDPTLRHGCRNWRPIGASLGAFRILQYTVDGSDVADACPLVPGQTYYFNLAIMNPNDGIQAGELNCLNSQLTECGIQMRAE